MIPLDKDATQAVDDMLHAARVTLSEHQLAAAARSSSTSKDQLEVSKTAVNNQIKSWKSVSIKISDIHHKLWTHAQQITGGKQPHD